MVEIYDVAKETLEILKYFDVNFTSKISKNFINSLEKISEKSKIVVKIDLNKNLIEQKISEESKDLISLIYYNYFADNAEKRKLIKIWKANDDIYKKELCKNDINNTFKKRKRDTKEEINLAENKLPIEVKRNLFVKIIDYIKNIFKK